MMIPLVIAITSMMYIYNFNSTMKLYKDSMYTMTLQELLIKRYEQIQIIN
jgi:hypothetical protein